VELVGTTGQELRPSEVIAKIVDLPSLSIKSDVMADDAQFVKKGGRVAIVFSDQADRKFDGTVRKVDALPATNDGKVLYEATIDFTNTDGAIRPSSVVKSIGVIVGQRKGVLAVPVDAVGKGSGDTAFVNVQTSKGFVKATVTLGLDDGNFVEIKSGLSDGDTVQVATGRGAWLTSAAPAPAQSKK
jgi:HlyD family secretion protein